MLICSCLFFFSFLPLFHSFPSAFKWVAEPVFADQWKNRAGCSSNGMLRTLAFISEIPNHGKEKILEQKCNRSRFLKLHTALFPSWSVERR